MHRRTHADAVPVSELPSWVGRGAGAEPRVTLGDEGIAVVAGKRGTLVRWQDVLGVVLPSGSDASKERAFVLVAREPPAEPWFEITPEMLPEGLAEAGLSGLASEVHRRGSLRSYRDGPGVGPTMDAEALLLRARRREPIAGAVEVPLADIKAAPSWQRAALAAAATPTVAAMGAQLGILTELFLSGPNPTGPADPLLAVLFGALAGTVALCGSIYVTRRKQNRSKRVLLLSPDGCVCGFNSGVRALLWDQVTGFAIEPSPTAPELQCITVRGQGGETLGYIDTHWFDVPAEVVVGVADAYRQRQERSAPRIAATRARVAPPTSADEHERPGRDGPADAKRAGIR